jgi:hypothetical protein
MAYLGFQCLDHPPYSPDLAPSDYRLFPGLRKQLKGRHFSSDAEGIAATEHFWITFVRGLSGNYEAILNISRTGRMALM